MILYRFLIILGSLTACTFSCTDAQKIKGVCYVAPREQVGREALQPIANVHATHVAITPYAFVRKNSHVVEYHDKRQHWGESVEGVKASIRQAHELNLKVMLKPHVWIGGQGWAGDFDLPDEAAWQEWQASYRQYILRFAKVAAEMQVEMFCIGTEIRKSVNKHPSYWQELISEVRSIYTGKLTYAANWDNYSNITFWRDLDYIGIDAYWPLSEKKNPNVDDIMDGWITIKSDLAEFSRTTGKLILFTEYGYESRDYGADGHWKHNIEELSANEEVQANAYTALHRSFFNEDWFAGGYLWKWFSNHSQVGGRGNKRYTPQNKLGEQVVKDLYNQ